ncbi:hypothetical protein PtB15_7B353 [Puccinia triticina]|nr:hypothetical protein PtB15_7B353 [Puccinia triticina]
MSDFSAAPDPLLEAFAVVRRNSSLRLRDYHSESDDGEEDVNVTQEDLEEQNKLLDELLFLLPSIKDELKALSNALNLPSHFSGYQCLNVEMTLETLSNLDQTLQKTSHF